MSKVIEKNNWIELDIRFINGKSLKEFVYGFSLKEIQKYLHKNISKRKLIINNTVFRTDKIVYINFKYLIK